MAPGIVHLDLVTDDDSWEPETPPYTDEDEDALEGAELGEEGEEGDDEEDEEEEGFNPTEEEVGAVVVAEGTIYLA